MNHGVGLCSDDSDTLFLAVALAILGLLELSLALGLGEHRVRRVVTAAGRARTRGSTAFGRPDRLLPGAGGAAGRGPCPRRGGPPPEPAARHRRDRRRPAARPDRPGFAGPRLPGVAVPPRRPGRGRSERRGRAGRGATALGRRDEGEPLGGLAAGLGRPDGRPGGPPGAPAHRGSPGLAHAGLVGDSAPGDAQPVRRLLRDRPGRQRLAGHCQGPARHGPVPDRFRHAGSRGGHGEQPAGLADLLGGPGWPGRWALDHLHHGPDRWLRRADPDAGAVGGRPGDALGPGPPGVARRYPRVPGADELGRGGDHRGDRRPRDLRGLPGRDRPGRLAPSPRAYPAHRPRVRRGGPGSGLRGRDRAGGELRHEVPPVAGPADPGARHGGQGPGVRGWPPGWSGRAVRRRGRWAGR